MDVVVLTGTEHRHRFMRMALGSAEDINIVYAFCESTEGTALDQADESGSQIQIGHLKRRARVEEDFFWVIRQVCRRSLKSTQNTTRRDQRPATLRDNPRS